jgi:hypothetical protein
MDLETALDEFADAPDAMIDLTDPKTFAAAGVIAILLGFMIGIGYLVVFNSVDCVTPFAGKTICFPNTYGQNKLTVVAVTVIAGILTGVSPYVIKHVRRYYMEKHEENDGS